MPDPTCPTCVIGRTACKWPALDSEHGHGSNIWQLTLPIAVPGVSAGMH